MDASPGLYSSPKSVPAQPPSVNHPAVSFLYEPVKYSSPETKLASATPGVSSGASWNTAPGWDPVEESATLYTVSRTSQPPTDVGALPPPPLYLAGELENYVENLEHGNLEMETEELSFAPPPPPPPGPYPRPVFQAGELSKSASIFEHGDEERETEEQGFMPPYSSAPQGAQEMPAAFVSEGPMQPVSHGFKPDLYHLFLTGQLPPGTHSHFQSDYETGRDHWGEVHYERYYYPVAEQPTIPTQTQDVPSDEQWQQPQYYIKTN